MKKTNGFGIASLTLGIIGLVFSFVPIQIGIFPAVIGLILGIIGLIQKNSSKGTSIGGVVCSSIGIVMFTLIVFSFYVREARAINENEKIAGEIVWDIEDSMMDIQENKNQDSEAEIERNVNIIYEQDFLVDGKDLKLSITEANGKININSVGYADTEEKASLMFATLISKLDDTSADGYTVLVNCGGLYAMCFATDNGVILSGTNEDGTLSTEMPDWIVFELTMGEDEINAYASEVVSALKEFGENKN